MPITESFAKGLSLCAAPSDDTGAPTPPPPLLHELGDGVYVFEWLYCNSPFIVSDKGVLVMDTYNDFYAEALEKQIAELTDKPVTHVVYSHANTDHIRGAGRFSKTATYIAQDRQIPRLEYIKEPSFPMPDQLFDKSHRVTLDDREINLIDYGINHATGVMVMHLPESGIITAIDTAYVKRLAYYFMPDFNPRAWRDSLFRMADLEFDRAVTGHGTPVATRQDYHDFANYLDDLIKQTEAVWNKVNHFGPFEGVEIAKKEVDLSKYKDWAFYDQFRDLNIMAVYHSIDMGF